MSAAGDKINIMTNEELIKKAESVLNQHKSNDRQFGDVGAALLSTNGVVHTGVSVDTPSWGLCAERSAIAAMVTAGEFRINSIVAVWRDEHDAKLYVLPPCGYCRQFMRDVDEANLETKVILGKIDEALLKELLPRFEWPQPLV